MGTESRCWMTGGAAFVSVTIFLVFLPAWSTQNPYCQITKDHTLCKFPGIGPRCKGLYDRGIPLQDRETIMNMHNTMRQLVATGNEHRGKPGPQPSAANMRQMEWDDELAASAQRLADQCKYTHDCLTCRKVDRFLTGQNLYQFSENLIREGSNWPQAINAWYDEVADFSPSSIDHFKFVKVLGHFTQMLWADTEKMGCGYSFYNEGKWNRKLYICNYGPAGNIITTPMYERGPACSNCPEGTYCSNQYPGLCTAGRGSSSFNYSPVAAKPAPTPRPTNPPTIPTTTTRRTTTTTTTRRPTTTTTTTTPRPTTTTTLLPPINYNEIETNELLPIENRFGFPSRKGSRRVNQLTTPSAYYRTTTTTTGRPLTTGYQQAYSRFISTGPSARVTVSYDTQRPTTSVFTPSRRIITTSRPRTQSSTYFNQPYSQRQYKQPTTTTRITITPVPTTVAAYYQPQQQQYTSNSNYNNNNYNTYYNQPSSSSQPDIIENQAALSTFSPTPSRFSSGPSNSLQTGSQTHVLRLVDSPVVGIQDMNSILLFCDFDYAKCPIRFTGDSWNYTISETPGFGRGFETVVSPHHLTNLYIRSVMHPNGEGNVCLYFRYINYRFSPDGTQAKSGNKPLGLRVTAGTLRQKPKIVEIPDLSITPRDWLTARIQFSNLRSMFLLIFQLPTNYLEDNVYVAIDDVLVTQGMCHT